MATEEVHRSYLLGGRAWLRALLKAAELHARVQFQGLIALIHGLIALSGVASGVSLQCCQLVLHKLYVIGCRGALSRVFLSLMRAESSCQLRPSPKKPYQESQRDSTVQGFKACSGNNVPQTHLRLQHCRKGKAACS